MKKALKKEAEVFHFVNGKKIYGFHSDVSGNLTDVCGDLDECEISDSDRKKGVNIEDLILNGGD